MFIGTPLGLESRHIIQRPHHRQKRQDGDEDIDRSIKLELTVEVGVFTEHLLYLQYCDEFGPSRQDCTNGIEELNDYIYATMKGV